MDSNETNRPLTEVPMDKTPETLVSSPAQAEENNTMYVPKQTKEEVIKRLKELNEDACNADKQELDLLKQTFYKLHKAEQETARKTFIEAGGAPEAFVMPSDDSESRFKEAMSSIKEKRSAMLAEQEKEKEENLQKKMYDFVVNIIFYESNMVQQLRSPDIAYGTMLAYLGFGGSVIYLIFYWKMMIAFFRKRTENPYFLVITVLMITGLALSLFGDSLSNPSAFALHYILLGLLFKNINIQDESIIYNRNH